MEFEPQPKKSMILVSVILKKLIIGQIWKCFWPNFRKRRIEHRVRRCEIEIKRSKRRRSKWSVRQSARAQYRVRGTLGV